MRAGAITTVVSHQVIDERSLELHRAIVDRLRANPPLIEVARDNLRRWAQRHQGSPSLLACDEEWQSILDENSFEAVLALLTENSERAQRLRQNSPFAGILTPHEVRSIKRK